MLQCRHAVVPVDVWGFAVCSGLQLGRLQFTIIRTKERGHREKMIDRRPDRLRKFATNRFDS